MAWTDKPSDAQIERLFQWLKWQVSEDEARKAVHWLRDNANRREVSNEMKRIHDLKEKRLLDRSKCFTSEIWEGFDYETKK